MKAIAYGEVKRVVRKSQAFKNFKSDFIKKLNAFSEYPRAIDITVGSTFEFIVKIREYQREDKVLSLTIGFSSRSLLSKHCYDSKELSELVENNIIGDLTDLLNEYYQEEFEGSWREFKGIELREPDRYGCPRIDKFIAWDYGQVGIWWVEQECGEHWITLPTRWDSEMPPMFHRDIDKKNQ